MPSPEDHPANTGSVYQNDLFMVVHVVGSGPIAFLPVHFHIGNALGLWSICKFVHLNKIPLSAPFFSMIFPFWAVVKPMAKNDMLSYYFCHFSILPFIF